MRACSVLVTIVCVLIGTGPAAMAGSDPGLIVIAPGSPIITVKTPPQHGEEVEAMACTLTAIGYDDERRLVGITAGHCARIGTVVYSEDDPHTGPIGEIVKIHHDMSHPPTSDASAPDTEDMDFAVIEFDPDVVIPSAEVHGADPGVTAGRAGGAAHVGDAVCTSGRTTGFSCGEIKEVNGWAHVTSLCIDEGDSGAPVLENGDIVGLVTMSWTLDGATGCGTESGTNLDAVLEAIGPGVGHGFRSYVG